MANAYIVLMAENREVSAREVFPLWVVEQDGKKLITPGKNFWEYQHGSDTPIDVTHVRIVVDEDTQFDYPIQLHTVNGVARAKWFRVNRDDTIEFRITIPEGNHASQETV